MKCIFCSKLVEKGKGLMFVRKDGKVLEFCSKKCERNMLNLGRNQNNMKWSKKREE
ncbi:50S ribosomal protein L24e [Candidatus Tiddalikarchaeum anstoanum]|nr:50S ribosomal protein L24e [Candidatus Tiddalikarchaeum anstoanum]